MFKMGICSVSLFLMVSMACAHPISIADNSTATIKISNYALTRIFVKQDAIDSVRGLDGSYLLTKDEKSGEIYILPTTKFKKKTFNLFVTTQEGRHYNLLLIPQNIASQTIELIPLSAGKSAVHFENTTVYEHTLITLIQAMMNTTVPEGYVSFKSQSPSFSWPWNSMKIDLKTVYRGKSFQGERWEIKNQSSKTLDLTEYRFFQPKTLALALEDFKLAPHQKTFLYRVIRYD